MAGLLVGHRAREKGCKGGRWRRAEGWKWANEKMAGNKRGVVDWTEAPDPTMLHNRAPTMVLHMKEGREWRPREIGARSVILYLTRVPHQTPCFCLPHLSPLYRRLSAARPLPVAIFLLPTSFPSTFFCFPFFMSLFFRREATTKPVVSWKCVRETALGERGWRLSFKINSFPYSHGAL